MECSSAFSTSCVVDVGSRNRRPVAPVPHDSARQCQIERWPRKTKRESYDQLGHGDAAYRNNPLASPKNLAALACLRVSWGANSTPNSVAISTTPMSVLKRLGHYHTFGGVQRLYSLPT